MLARGCRTCDGFPVSSRSDLSSAGMIGPDAVGEILPYGALRQWQFSTGMCTDPHLLFECRSLFL